MSKSNIGGQGPIRPKIFSQWPRRPISIPSTFAQETRKKDKYNQSLRAQQALRKSLMLSLNIQGFLKQKQRYQKQYEKHAQISEQCKRNLQEMSRQNGKPFDQNKYQQQLRKYYLHIRDECKYLKEAESFVYSNLQNYDSRVTAPKFTRLPGEAFKQLKIKLEDLQEKRRQLQESLTMFEQNIQPSQILHSQPSFQLCLQNLLKQLSEENLQQIHYLMLYQLLEVSASHNSFMTNIENDRSSYATFEAINDSMKLMLNQRQQMKKDRRLIEKVYNDLRMDNAQYIIPSSSSSLPILLKNEKVYDANKQLLARYNAETNLAQYSYRRKLYIQQLSKYKSKLMKWKAQQQISSYLYSRHQVLNRYLRQVSLGDNVVAQKSQRDDVYRAYYECLNLQIPESMPSIRKYKLSLIADIGDTLEKQGIIISERGQLLSSGRLNNSTLIHRQENRFHKYLNLFIELQSLPSGEKIENLMQKKDTIRALQYELDQTYLDSSHANNYKVDLGYCQTIISHQQNGKDNEYISRVEQHRKQRWVGLPIGLDSLVFNYTNDVFIKMEANNYINQIFQPKLQEISDLVSSSIQKNNKNLSSQGKQYPYLNFNLKPQQRRHYFYAICSKISKFNPKMKMQLLKKYWDVAEEIIFRPYIQAIQNQKKFQVLKSQFFTFRILSYLKKQGEGVKLSNFEQLVDFYISSIDKYINKWDQVDLFMQIIKQRTFIKFLQQKLTKKIDVQVQLAVMKRINEACILLYHTNEHISLVDTTDLQPYLSYGIKIHQSWQQISSLNIDPQRKLQVQQKCKNFLRGIFKSPIDIGTKVNLQNVQSLLCLDQKFQKLKIINTLVPNISFLSAVFIRCSNLIQISQNLSQPFTHSDLLMPRQVVNKSLYLEKVQQNCKKQILPLKPLLLTIVGIYKGKQNTKSQMQNVRGGSEVERILIEIISKLDMIRR